MLDVESRIEVSSALNALDVGIILLDRQSRIVLWNDWIARVTGCPEPSVRGKSIYDVMPSLRDTRLESAIADTFDAGSSSILTHSLNSRLLLLRGDSGEELLHNVVVRPVFSGQSQHCLLQINDVTIAVTRERVLRERQNARYHAIVETAPDAIITIDLDRTIQWLNSVAEHAFGYPPSDLLGQKIDMLLDKNDEAATFFSEDGQQAGEKGVAHQLAGRHKSGALAHFEVSTARWKSNDRIFITTIWREVTERLKSEQALRESEGRHRTLLQALPQLVWTCNAGGECDYFNSQWQIYTGGSAAEHFGNGWLGVIHPAERQQFEADWKEALANRTVFDIESQLRRHDGTYRWFKIRSIPMLGASKAATQWFGTATDITELIEARDTLRTSNEELELRVAARTKEREMALAQLYESQKMETIGQLTGGVAHDFNNLLAVILGSLSLLKKALPEDPRTSRLLDGALQGAERGATLTKRLLAFARRQELKLAVVDIKRLIPDLLDFLRQSVGPNISIDVRIADDTKRVTIDANQLELALMNLAVNSRDAMPKGGTLTITCCNETSDQSSLPRTLPRGDYVRVSVADSGEGMSEATRLRSMDPFFTTKGIGKGTGLGLSMVHGMTAQSGGAMDIRSQPGKGTTVTLWLPQAREEEDNAHVVAPQVSPAEDSAVRKLRILLVDDDALVSMNSAYMLMDLGHSVLEAHSGAHALQLLESDAAFDVVITDYAMPGMNGLDLATKIRELRPKIPVILATGYAELAAEAPVEFPRLGKPYSQEQLARALEAVLQSGLQLDREWNSRNGIAESGE